MSNTFFSIITVNFNNKSGLVQSINSVLSQSCNDYEYIIIDGQSTDGSKEIIESHSNNLSYWVSEKDNGVYDAMNKAIHKATGKYLFFLNSGDRFAVSEVLQTIKDSAITESPDWIYGNTIIKNKLIKYQPKLSLYYILTMSISHQAQFFKKELFNLQGLYDLEYKITADSVHLILCFVRHNISYKYIDTTISIIEPDGMSTKSFEANTAEKERFMQKELPLLIEDYKALQYYKRLNIFERLKNLLRRKFSK